MASMRIGFVGLGLMGGGMVRNLLAAGFPVVGYDLDPAKVEALVPAGISVADDPAAMADAVDVILLSLPNSHVVDAVAADVLQLFAKDRQGLILIDTTTADPILSQALSVRLEAKGVTMLDATISGTSRMCAARDVTFMVGGSRQAFETCEPIFAALGKQSFYMGGNGTGASAKLVVNLVLGLNRMVLAEGLSLAKKAGMDPHRALEVLKGSAAYSSAMDQKGLKMVEGDLRVPEGKLGFHLKDVRLMLELGQRVNAPLPLTALHAQALGSEVAKGRAEWDNADIISFYEELGGGAARNR